MKDTDTLQEVGNVKDCKRDHVTVDMLREWLTENKHPYSWIASKLGVSESSVKQWMSPNFKKDIPEKHQKSIKKIIAFFTYREDQFTKDKQDNSAEQQCQHDAGVNEDGSASFTLPPVLVAVLKPAADHLGQTLQMFVEQELYEWASRTLMKQGVKVGPPIQGSRLHIKIRELERRIQAEQQSIDNQEKALKQLRDELNHADTRVKEFPGVSAYQNYAQTLNALIEDETSKKALMEYSLKLKEAEYQHLCQLKTKKGMPRPSVSGQNSGDR